MWPSLTFRMPPIPPTPGCLCLDNVYLLSDPRNPHLPSGPKSLGASHTGLSPGGLGQVRAQRPLGEDRNRCGRLLPCLCF